MIKELITRNLEQVLPSVDLPFCNASSPYYDQTACHYYKNYTQTLLNYYEELNATIEYYIDEHTVKVYLNYLELEQKPNVTSSPVETLGIIEGGEVPCPLNPFDYYSYLGSKLIEFPTPIFEYFGARYGTAKAELRISYTLQGAYGIAGNVRLSVFLGGLIHELQTGLSYFAGGSVSIRNRVFGSDATLGVALREFFVINVAKLIITYVKLGIPPEIGCKEVFLISILPTFSVDFTEYVPPKSYDYCTPCSSPKKILLHNSTDPRHMELVIRDHFRVEGWGATSFGIKLEVGGQMEYVWMTTTFGVTTDSRFSLFYGWAREFILDLYFYDNNETKQIEYIKVTEYPYTLRYGSSTSKFVETWPTAGSYKWMGGVSWCITVTC